MAQNTPLLRINFNFSETLTKCGTGKGEKAKKKFYGKFSKWELRGNRKADWFLFAIFDLSIFKYYVHYGKLKIKHFLNLWRTFSCFGTFSCSFSIFGTYKVKNRVGIKSTLMLWLTFMCEVNSYSGYPCTKGLSFWTAWLALVGVQVAWVT